MAWKALNNDVHNPVEDVVQMMDLYAAGWKLEGCPDPLRKPIFCFAWRRPPRTKKSKGMRFGSTNQAWRAMTLDCKYATERWREAHDPLFNKHPSEGFYKLVEAAVAEIQREEL